MWERTLPTGLVLNGKYQIEKVIGEGDFGITYLCCNTMNSMKVAVKEYYPIQLVKRDMTGRSNSVMVLSNQYMATYSKGVKRFVREAKAISSVGNVSGIAAVRDIFYENNTAYMVMDYVEGVKLSQYLTRGRIGVDVCLQLFMPVISALGMIHKQGVLHRDINPDNFIITADNRLVLVDFGAARVMDISDEQALVRILKPGFAPIEEYRAQGAQGPWTDIYSLCATILYAISGIVPDLASVREDGDVLFEKINNLNLQKDISRILKKGLSTNADNRFESMEELYGCLYEGKSVGNSAKLLIIIIAIVVILLAVVGGLFGLKAIKENTDEETETEVDIEFMEDETNNDSENEAVTDENGDAPKGAVEELRAIFTKANKDELIEKELCDDFDGDDSYEMYIVSVKQAGADGSGDEIKNKDDKKKDRKKDAGNRKGDEDKDDKEDKKDIDGDKNREGRKDIDIKIDVEPSIESIDVEGITKPEDTETVEEDVSSDDATEPATEEIITEKIYSIWFVTEKKGCTKLGEIEASEGSDVLISKLSLMSFEEAKVPYVIGEFKDASEGYTANINTYVCDGKKERVEVLENTYIEEVEGSPYAMVQSDDKCAMRIEMQHTMPYLAYPLKYVDGELVEVASVNCGEEILNSLTDWEDKKSEIEQRFMDGSIEGLYWPDNFKPVSVQISDVFYNDNGHIYVNYIVKCEVQSDDGATSGCDLAAEADLTLMDEAIREYHCYGGVRLAEGVKGLTAKAIESSPKVFAAEGEE